MNTHVQTDQVERESVLVQFWNETLAPKFVKYRHIMEGGLSRYSDVVMPLLDVRPGDKVLDVGCGFGDTAMALGRRVGTKGTVLGVDCCDAFLDLARNRPERMFLQNVRFENRDAETYLGDAEYDYVFARFGTMFFFNPVAGLRSMRRAMRPCVRLANFVWRQKSDHPWVFAALDMLRRFLSAPGTGARTCEVAQLTTTLKQSKIYKSMDHGVSLVATPAAVRAIFSKSSGRPQLVLKRNGGIRRRKSKVCNRAAFQPQKPMWTDQDETPRPVRRLQQTRSGLWMDS